MSRQEFSISSSVMIVGRKRGGGDLVDLIAETMKVRTDACDEQANDRVEAVAPSLFEFRSGPGDQLSICERRKLDGRAKLLEQLRPSCGCR